jgi:hypothetical protein
MKVVVGKVCDFANGDRKIVEVNGKSIGVFRIGDRFYALRNRCPHQFGPLCLGTLAPRAVSAGPGDVRLDAGPPRAGRLQGGAVPCGQRLAGAGLARPRSPAARQPQRAVRLARPGGRGDRVFDAFPRLQVALVEACLTWAGPLQWAMDAAYAVAGADAPRLSRLPSEYFREHFWLSTQPVEEPDNPRHLVQSIEFAQLTDRVMFSSDYPHWDFDSPVKALPAAMPAAMRDKIMGENAARLYAGRLGRG